MKQRGVLILSLLALLNITTVAQDYRPLVSEGKLWKEYSRTPIALWEYTYTISGDTLIAGEEYHKLYIEYIVYDLRAGEGNPVERYNQPIVFYAGLQEQGGRVYIYQHDRKSTLYDFALEEGSIAFEKNGDQQRVVKVDTIAVSGILRRRLWLSEYKEFESDLGESTGYWVEGIGSSWGLVEPFDWSVLNGGRMLRECIENGVCVFTAADFDAPPYIPVEPGFKKCAPPTITYDKGRLVFDSETSGAECVYEIKCADTGSGSGSEVSLNKTYEIRVHATLDGWDDSDVAVATIGWRNGQPVMEDFSIVTLEAPTNLPPTGETTGDVNGDGKVDVADIATVIAIMAGE
jgi:hypothetical protein